ncbi:glucosamine-6-phosphate deaminase [Rhodopirellula bahusiensis]|uniref:Glucosamine-6-phosphate deaminase n=1 Tax=Rhodopirellula bahusiensis TaxID=2014065 RepID=A0A2G1W145_9BACT|nr:glucosamine-6-phosphate deaminase [Rhodopirellula bahusiensis]PHQ32746.1 glucosamine-6-phosphate deaminase [Rhodopirellula bahusiensis]
MSGTDATHLVPQSPKNKIAYRVYPESTDASAAVAREIADLIRSRAAESKTAVLGLVAGSSPVNVYAELIRLHREENLSLANVVTFNLDEYYPMQPACLQSHSRFMHEHLFDHVDIRPENIHLPDGTEPVESIAESCSAYDQKMLDAGGIDIQLLGIGRTGHIGFNEPGSGTDSRTRMITLDGMTRIDSASHFFGVENVPRRAITMGVATILQARKIFLLAFGEGKSSIIARTIEGELAPSVPATSLQQHPDTELILDRAAAAQLTVIQSPWLVDKVIWDDTMVRRAVIDLSQALQKPVLMLVDGDYNENGLQDLLAEHGSAYEINLRVFRHLQSTITGWPAGKPNQPDVVFPKRIVLFSPHPDDDVISMGGTLTRLADQGHEVHVAYQTSGNIAVFDGDAIRFAKFAREFCKEFDLLTPPVVELTKRMIEFLGDKDHGEVDIPEMQRLKGLIRRGEAEEGAIVCGVPAERLHFLELPFYETGVVRKSAISDADIQITVDLLREVQPHQIYAAGDLSDPHGTHRTCLEILLAACERCQDDEWMSHCVVWLYRGAWQEWAPHEIEMAVPLSPQEVDRKRAAIFKHESQKDRALFPGADAREFWQRAEARNASTARTYDQLGLAQYQAIEGFVEYKRPQS